MKGTARAARKVRMGVDKTLMAFERGLGRPWNKDQRSILEMTDPYTMVDRRRRTSMLKLIDILESRSIPGSFIECGVARGGVSALLGLKALKSPMDRYLWLFDSFEGLPEPTPDDGPEAAAYAGGRVRGQLTSIGQCVGTLEEVDRLLFDSLHLPRDRIRLVKGWFQKSLATYDGGVVALLHVDGDWYESTKTCLEHFWPLMSPGGYVVIDDYGHWLGARKAVDAFLRKERNPPTLFRRGYTQAFFKK